MLRRLRETTGQTTLEYLALIALVAALGGLLATLAPAMARTMTKVAEVVICRAGGGSCGGVQAQAASLDPWDSPDPVTRATWGTYVSLGDSYSAGEGLGDYQPGSHVEKSQCKVGLPLGGPCVYHKDPKVIDGCDRSASAYNSTVSGDYRFKGGKQTWACSGSTTLDVYDPDDPSCKSGHASGPNGEGCQINHVNKDTSLVTMTIGGNDADFANDLKDCYTNRFKLHWSHPCSQEAGSIDQKIAALGPRLEQTLQAIHARAPHARIVIVTYPRMFPKDPTSNAACVTIVHVCLTPDDQRFFNDEAEKLDKQICASVAAAGVGAECVDGLNAFDGCEIGTRDSCLQSPETHISGSTGIGINPGAFHPSKRGQRILGELINGQIAHPS